MPLADKPSVSVIIGQPTGLRYKDPDALALRVGTAILGSGFTGPADGHRARQGRPDLQHFGAACPKTASSTARWDISASFAPALLEKGIASTRRELDRWWKDGVTEEELASAQAGSGRRLPRRPVEHRAVSRTPF